MPGRARSVATNPYSTSTLREIVALVSVQRIVLVNLALTKDEGMLSTLHTR